MNAASVSAVSGLRALNFRFASIRAHSVVPIYLLKYRPELEPFCRRELSEGFLEREEGYHCYFSVLSKHIVKLMPEQYDFPTLPDYLRPGLDVVFIGINPGLYSVRYGHYFARSTSRFWPAFSRSRLSERMRRELRIGTLLPGHDSELPRFGMGLTDVVKWPSANAAELTRSDFAKWIPVLVEKLRHYAPRVACFHGLTAYRPFCQATFKPQAFHLF